MKIKIKDLPIKERPRERLIDFGPSSLSDEELLAIIIKSGSKEYSAKELAMNIIVKYEDLKKLVDITYEELLLIKGIGPAKAAFLLATFELAKRINIKELKINNTKYNNPELIFRYFKNKIGSKEQEHFYALYLNNRKKIVGERLLYVGTINHSLVHPREIFKQAYLLGASSIVLVHNHPNGNSKPSNDDVITTKKLIEVGSILGVNVVDHIIIGFDNYYSFFENNSVS